MNAAEERGYAWLLECGYRPAQIEFQPNRSPDFLTSDGRGFEVKAPTNDRGIYFETSQMRSLAGTTVVIFDFDGTQTVAPFDDLKIPGRLGRYRLRVRQPGTIHKSIEIPATLHVAVSERLVKDRRTFSDVVRDALEAYAGSKA